MHSIFKNMCYLKCLIFLLISVDSLATDYLKYIKSVGMSANNPSIDTEYTAKINSSSKDIRFQSNTSGGYRYFLGTSYLDLSFSVKNNYESEVPQSSYNDFYLRSRFSNFEIVIHQGNFVGGNISEGPLTEDDVFYDDYSVSKSHLRGSYYSIKNFASIYRRPKKISSLVATESKKYFSSWITSLGYEASVTNFPAMNSTEQKSVFKMNDTFDMFQSLENQTIFSSLGYAGIYSFTESFSFSFRLSIGWGLQNSEYFINNQQYEDDNISNYNDLDIGINYLINNKHNLAVLADNYSQTTNISNTTVRNSVSQIALMYQYFL